MHSVLNSVTRRVKGSKASGQKPETRTATADEALAALPPDLKVRLGALAEAPQKPAELAIALLPYGYRALLAGYGLIEMTVPGTDGYAEPESPRRQIRLLDLGKRIIEACADPPAPVGGVSEINSDAAALRERYEPDLPFEAEETEV